MMEIIRAHAKDQRGNLHDVDARRRSIHRRAVQHDDITAVVVEYRP